MEQADRERLKRLRNYVDWYGGDGHNSEHGLARLGYNIANLEGGGTYQNRLAWARQEIARLEAIEFHTNPANAPKREVTEQWVDNECHERTYDVTFSATGLDALTTSSMTIGEDGVIYMNMPYATQPGDSIAVEIGSTDDGPPIKSFTIKRGDPPYRFTNDTPDGEYRAVESLDDFMRERAAKREPAEAVDPTPEEAATMLDIAFEQQPASRELVERMVREATSHSLWPVEIVDDYKDYSLAALAHQPQGPRLIIALCDRATDDYESLLGVVQTARESTDALNEEACPACNGSAKVRGYFFGEKQCPDCEGTGVR